MLINFAEIEIPDQDIPAIELEYIDENHYQVLKSTHFLEYVFRKRHSKIVAVPVVENPQPIFGKSYTFSLHEDKGLACALIRHSLIDYLFSRNLTISRYDPIQFTGSGNILKEAISRQDLFNKIPSYLSIKSRYQAVVRTVYFDINHPKVGMFFSSDTSRIIAANCRKLLQDGVNFTGLYVGRFEYSFDKRISPAFRLVGKALEIKNDKIVLDDFRDVIEIPLDEAYLEPRSENIYKCLSQFLSSDYTNAFEKINKYLLTYRQGDAELKRIQDFLKFLSLQTWSLIPGVEFKISPNFISKDKNLDFPSIAQASTPIYVYSPDKTMTNRSADPGLNEYGPYSSYNFTPIKPNICIICQRSRKGEVSQFINKFLKGDEQFKYFKKGFVKKYYLQEPQVGFFLAESPTKEAYRKAVQEALRAQTDELKWHIALVQIDELFHKMPASSNPYLLTKAALLSRDIPSQHFEYETTKNLGIALDSTLNNIALAVYAKLKGVPWTLMADQPIEQELVFGLGSAEVGNGRLGDRQKMVGITTVFNGYGIYRLHNITNAVPAKDYQETLLSSVREVIDQLKSDSILKKRSSVRLIFHSFKPFKNAEADAIDELISELGDFDVEYAFLHLKQDHPYTVYDLGQSGSQDYTTRKIKGKYVPYRGKYLVISKTESLISLHNSKIIKYSDGMPKPLLLQLHEKSNFRDMEYLTKQVFIFSCHSWKSFIPPNLPVTVYYSDLIANLLGNFSSFIDLGYALTGRIGYSRWFL